MENGGIEGKKVHCFSIQKKKEELQKEVIFTVAATPAIASKFWEQLAPFFAAISSTIIKDIDSLYKSYLS